MREYSGKVKCELRRSKRYSECEDNFEPAQTLNFASKDKTCEVYLFFYPKP